VESSGNASTICWAVQFAVGCSVTLKWTMRRRWWASTTRTKSTRKPAVGTVKKIDGGEIRDVVGEERSPRLGGWRTSFRHQSGDGALGDLDPQLEELSVDSWCTPQGVCRGHFSDKRGGLSADRRAAQPRPAGEPHPVLTKATARPPQDGVRRHDDESLSPAGPYAGEPDPQEAVGGAQSGPRDHPLVHGELLAQGEVFEGELSVAAE
jgi:hypothetical protein